jgi:Fanconi anemia group M protein
MAATDDVARIEHPLLTPGFLERRLYQLQLAGTAQTADTLVCLPTGLGKTTVSLLVTAERLQDVDGTALMLAPTKPLVQQHAEFYREALQIPDEEIVVFTGEVRPEDRAALWADARVVIATPQVVENDLVGNRISLRDVTHLTFDECHRATGDYAYVYIAERYHADAADPLVTGMSASPGGDEEEILQVCENLGIQEVEVMTEEDADVADFTHDTDVQWERVDLPDEILEIRDLINEVISDRLEDLKELGVTNTTQPDLSQKKLNGMRAELQKLINNDQSEGYQGMSTHAEVMKLRRAVELVETQSVESVRRYFERQREDARSSGASKASQRMVSDPRVRRAMRKAQQYDDLHPKFSNARILLAQTLGIGEGERVIVFTESRDTAEALTEFLGQSFETRKFVGQGDKEGSDGMTQTQQQERLDAFRNGEFEVLVSTSVAEEGLDVPEVDLVLFYEPVPTAIRSIQRKGRTGRQTSGKVVVLLANDTRDEAFFWISRRREQEMEDELRKLKSVAEDVEEELDDSQQSLGDFDGGSPGEPDEEAAERLEPGLTDFAEESGPDQDTDAETTNTQPADAEPDSPESDESEGIVATATATAATDTEEDHVEVVVDQRELDSPIAKELSRREGVETRLETLAVGDYVLSDRVAVERKSVSDFLDTLTGGDRSMFDQVGDLARAYARPVVILEGENLYDERNVHPNAIRGALSSLAIDFDASVLRTEDENDTADLLEVLATREQETSDRTVSVHGEKSGKTLAEQQEYVVGSVADIGPVTARSLLEEFGTVEAVMTARKEDLMAVSGVGEVTADRLREVVGSEYK